MIFLASGESTEWLRADLEMRLDPPYLSFSYLSINKSNYLARISCLSKLRALLDKVRSSS